ncbi:MAG TPA: GDSL-type esterase/lipase family protein [Phycisphaerae bacterium]|nr:GDSL-type esterase/lipase family protein [Phycisphaerae bacterium]
MRIPPSTTVLLLGDSITLGAAEIREAQVISTVAMSYVDHLRTAAFDCTFVVDAKVNRSTARAVNDLPGVLDSVKPDIVLLMLGGNDADMNWRRFMVTSGRVARSNVRPAEYGNNLRTMIECVRSRGMSPLITDIPDHDVTARGDYLSKLLQIDVAGMIRNSGLQETSDRELRAFWDQAALVSERCGVPLVSYGRKLVETGRNRVLGVDGVHPNAFAHRLIAQELLPVLRNVIRAGVARERIIPIDGPCGFVRPHTTSNLGQAFPM